MRPNFSDDKSTGTPSSGEPEVRIQAQVSSRPAAREGRPKCAFEAMGQNEASSRSPQTLPPDEAAAPQASPRRNQLKRRRSIEPDTESARVPDGPQRKKLSRGGPVDPDPKKRSEPGLQIPQQQKRFSGISSPVVGKLYRVYWKPSARWFVALLLPAGRFDSVGMSGCISETSLAKRIPICYRSQGKSIMGWKKGFGEGETKMAEREFPFMLFDDVMNMLDREEGEIPNGARFVWIEARFTRLFDADDPVCKRTLGYTFSQSFCAMPRGLREQKEPRRRTLALEESNSGGDRSPGDELPTGRSRRMTRTQEAFHPDSDGVEEEIRVAPDGSYAASVPKAPRDISPHGGRADATPMVLIDLTTDPEDLSEKPAATARASTSTSTIAGGQAHPSSIPSETRVVSTDATSPRRSDPAYSPQPNRTFAAESLYQAAGPRGLPVSSGPAQFSASQNNTNDTSSPSTTQAALNVAAEKLLPGPSSVPLSPIARPSSADIAQSTHLPGSAPASGSAAPPTARPKPTHITYSTCLPGATSPPLSSITQPTSTNNPRMTHLPGPNNIPPSSTPHLTAANMTNSARLPVPDSAPPSLVTQPTPENFAPSTHVLGPRTSSTPRAEQSGIPSVIRPPAFPPMRVPKDQEIPPLSQGQFYNHRPQTDYDRQWSRTDFFSVAEVLHRFTPRALRPNSQLATQQPPHPPPAPVNSSVHISLDNPQPNDLRAESVSGIPFSPGQPSRSETNQVLARVSPMPPETLARNQSSASTATPSEHTGGKPLAHAPAPLQPSSVEKTLPSNAAGISATSPRQLSRSNVIQTPRIVTSIAVEAYALSTESRTTATPPERLGCKNKLPAMLLPVLPPFQA